MQYMPFEPDIEVLGQAVHAIVDGFRLFRRLAVNVLQQEGIGRLRSDGELIIERQGWYSQAAQLRALARIADEAGNGSLFAVGRQVPETARIPPNVIDLQSAIRAIDIGYHLNHRKRGQVMFDLDTHEMLDGIGSYGCRSAGSREIIAFCHNPYPCDFDRGLITAMARKFEPRAHVEHELGPCRKYGHETCTYAVTW